LSKPCPPPTNIIPNITISVPPHSRVFRYNGKIHPHLPKLSTLLSELSIKGGQSPKVVVVTSGHGSFIDTDAWNPEWTTWDAFIENGRKSKLGRSPQGEIEWKRLPFDWPLWILFSSGTTGTCHFSKSVIDWAPPSLHSLSRQTKVSPESTSLLGFEFNMNDDRAIVHRAGGMLLQSRKELLVCADLTDKDVFFYYTTTWAFQHCSMLRTLITPSADG